jgi:hypothetical protein
MQQNTAGWVVSLAGMITFLGAILDWGIVTSRNKLLPRLLGPALTRPVMGAVGLGLVGLGLAIVFGWV